MKNVLKISLRQNAVYIPSEYILQETTVLNENTLAFITQAAKLGFTFSEKLLHVLNNIPAKYKLDVLQTIGKALGTDKNWTPLVKGWNVPTNESVFDHIYTYLANIFKSNNGIKLQCGHLIPSNSFPLERYNGCPFCGIPFELDKTIFKGQGSKLKVLDIWTDDDVQQFYISLLTSKTALDATQIDSLKVLLLLYPIPNVAIGMKETLMLILDELIAHKRFDDAQLLFKSPTDILRYLWYKHTGFLQIIEPKTIIKRNAKNQSHFYSPLDKSVKTAIEQKAALKLKYKRSECLMVAIWLNNLSMDVEQMCEIMHPKRQMWVRFIRALRLPEYSKRKGFEQLAKILDVFYNGNYTVWQGYVNHYRLRSDAEQTFALLKQRPGLFARSLFANMLWFGPKETITAFQEVADKVPARLLFTLNMYAKNYFDANIERSVKPLGGITKRISANALLEIYDEKALDEMKDMVEDLCINTMKIRFAKIPNENNKIFIEPALFNMPVPIGDRSESIQDLPVALMGTRYTLEGNNVRLFLQWGQSLKAQHLDMDLSCAIAYQNKVDVCSYSRLVTTGCKHSGDIRSIPDKVGTAEYIEINVDELRSAQAKYVTFSCNAYSNGSLSPNLVVGWMNSLYPMKISERSGVAYDPSCVQHQVRITNTVTKGLVFGVLDVEQREIIWLEMPFQGQVVQQLDIRGVCALLNKLNAKLSIGNLLKIKAEAQDLKIIEDVNMADEIYKIQWAINAANISQLLID